MADSNTGKYRLPFVKTEADVNAQKQLTAEQKALGISNLKKVPLTDGYALMGGDPEAQALVSMFENSLQHLLVPDMQANPGSPMNLITIRTAQRYKVEWMLGLMTRITEASIPTLGVKDFRAGNLGMMDQPDSAIWTAEQSLSLRFADALIDRAMTDGIMAEARKTWGEQRTIRLILWCGFVQHWTMIIDAGGLKWVPGSSSALERGINPAMITNMLRPKVAKTWDGLMSVWSSLQPPKPLAE